jgi:hypothetical protein
MAPADAQAEVEPAPAAEPVEVPAEAEEVSPGAVSQASLLPLAPPLAAAGGEAAELPATVEFSVPRRPGVVLGGGSRGDLDFEGGDDDFGNMRRATVLAGPLAPPGQPQRRLIRYDLLAGAAIVLALLALVPLLLLRGDPEEISSTPKVPAGGGDPARDVTVELAQPTDLTDRVQLNWKATRELDFAVVVAAEGEDTKVLLAERNHTMTVDVEPGIKYCFMVQASDGDRVYESDPQPLRGASCRK